MTADQENFVKMMFQALGEWWVSLGAFGWFILGILLVGGILFLVMLLRWILRGGLSRRMASGFSGHRSVADSSVRGDS